VIGQIEYNMKERLGGKMMNTREYLIKIVFDLSPHFSKTEIKTELQFDTDEMIIVSRAYYNHPTPSGQQYMVGGYILTRKFWESRGGVAQALQSMKSSYDNCHRDHELYFHSIWC